MSLLYRFHCKTCHKPIPLPSETLERTLEYLALSVKDASLAAVACHHCNHVHIYALKNTEPLTDDAAGVEPASDESSGMEFVASLLCDAEGCDAPLPLFAEWSATTTPAEKQTAAAAWRWADMTCQSGHPIRKPVAGSESFVSLRCPNGKREDSQRCDATFEHPRDWFEVGKRVECPLCGLTFKLTAEHIQELQ
jgi:uncharacterized Zn-finger protein